MPAAHPVHYLLDDEEIVFRTGNGAKLAAAARGVVVGFQVGEIDVERRSGWSVLGVGEAYEIRDPARLAALADRLPTLWPPDRTGHCISIPIQRLTGRWLSPSEWTIQLRLEAPAGHVVGPVGGRVEPPPTGEGLAPAPGSYVLERWQALGRPSISRGQEASTASSSTPSTSRIDTIPIHRPSSSRTGM
jgi:uncharacterized protein